MKQPDDASRTSVRARATEPAQRTADTQHDGAPARAPRRAPRPAPRSDAQPGLRLVRGSGRTIVDTAATDDSFATLVRVLRTAGMEELLAGDGPFTLFAPTDRAFARLPAGVLDELLADPARLKRVLAGHVVAGRVKAPQAGAPTSVTSVGGPELNVTVHNGTFRVDGARVVRPHLRASNGMIRALDTVLVRR